MTFVVTVLLQFLLLITILITNSEYIAWLSLLIPHLIIISSLGYVYFHLKLDIIWIWAGWIIIFLSNLALAWGSFAPSMVDFFSAAAKLVVYRGMSQPTFSVLADGLRRFVLGGIPTEYPEKYNGGLYLVNFRSSGREKEIHWIKNKIIENNLKGIRTVFISFFDLITPRDLFDKKTEGNFYFIRVLPGRRESAKLFEKQVTAISDDPNQIHLAFNEIIKTSKDTTVPVEVVIYTLSNAVITHGWRRMYTMMTSLIPTLKENKVRVTYIYQPDVHEDKTIVTKFEMLAEKIFRA